MNRPHGVQPFPNDDDRPQQPDRPAVSARQPADAVAADTKRFSVLGLLALAAAIAYLCRHPLGVAESTIRSELQLSRVQSGVLMGMFFWSYALFQLPGGALGHRWGTRWALSLYAAGWSAAMLLTGLSGPFAVLLAAQLLMGVAQAGLFPCSALVIRHWLPVRERGIGQGTLSAGMQVGAIVTAALTGRLLDDGLPWRSIFMIYAVPGFLWSAWFATRFREYPWTPLRSSDLSSSNAPPPAAHERVPWRVIASHATMWFLCGQQVFRAAGYAFFATWFPGFLQETRNISIADSGLLQSGVLAAAMAGGFLGGLLTDHMFRRTGHLRRSRLVPGAGGQVLCGVVILAAFFVTSAWVATALMTAGSFFSALGGTSATSVAVDTGGHHVARIFAVMNMLGNFAAAACPAIVGWIFERSSDWNVVLVLFAGIYFAAAVCWLFIDPNVDVTRPRSTRNHSGRAQVLR